MKIILLYMQLQLITQILIFIQCLVGKYTQWFIIFFFLIFIDPCIVVWLSRNNQQDATLY